MTDPLSSVMRWLPLLLLLPLLGCAHGDSLTTFARAGVAYSGSLDKALAAAERSAVDASSWRLLADDQLSNIDLAALEAANAQDAARSEQLDRLRTHSGLLARYLSAVAALANSDLPKEASKQVESLWTSTAALGQALLGSAVLPPAQVVTKPLEQLVDKAMHKHVRQYLIEHADALQRELVLQEEVLAALARAVAHERELARQAALQHAVILPLLAESPVAQPERWVEQRRSWLLSDDEPKELRDARRAARSLRTAFEALIEGRLDASAAARLEEELRSPGLLAGVEVPK